jgi:hypothetical protein
MRIDTLWRVTRRAAQDWWDDNCLQLAASLAYYTALAQAWATRLGTVVPQPHARVRGGATDQARRGRRAHPWGVSVDDGLCTVITPVPVTAWHPPASPKMPMTQEKLARVAAVRRGRG